MLKMFLGGCYIFGLFLLGCIIGGYLTHKKIWKILSFICLFICIACLTVFILGKTAVLGEY